MARIARIVVPGYSHQITQRGNRRQQTFFNDGDYHSYIELMSRWCRKAAVDIVKDDWKSFLMKAIDAKGFIKEAGAHLGFDPDSLSNTRRISGTLKDNRDLLIYFLWQSGKISNAQIGSLFSISSSAVSHAVKNIGAKLKKRPTFG